MVNEILKYHDGAKRQAVSSAEPRGDPLSANGNEGGVFSFPIKDSAAFLSDTTPLFDEMRVIGLQRDSTWMGSKVLAGQPMRVWTQ